MRGIREKDKEIMQLKATMSHGERTFNYVEGTLNIGGGDAVVAKPSSLSGSSMQSDPPYSGVGCNSPICKYNQPRALIGSAINADHYQASPRFAGIRNRPSTNEDLVDGTHQPAQEESSVTGPHHGLASSTLTVQPWVSFCRIMVPPKDGAEGISDDRI